MPTLPAELEAIILRCVAREPGRRYASARAVVADLRRYLDGEVAEASGASLTYRLTRFAHATSSSSRWQERSSIRR